MAAPTPTTKIIWDGRRGAARVYVAWTAGAPDNLSNATIIDISSLSPAPGHIKIRTVDCTLNGNYQLDLEWDDVATGVVNTATASNAVTWVSGDTFDTNWITWGNSTITINGTDYTLATIPSTTSATLSSDPGDQTAVAYTVDEFIDRFVGQADVSYQFLRDYTDGPSKSIPPVTSSSSYVGDLIISTSGVAAGDELSAFIIFEVL